MTPNIGIVWKATATGTMLFGIGTGVLADAEMWLSALYMAGLTGFGLALTVWAVTLDFQIRISI